MNGKSFEGSKDFEIVELRSGGFEIVSKRGTMQFRRGGFVSRAHAEEALQQIRVEERREDG